MSIDKIGILCYKELDNSFVELLMKSTREVNMEDRGIIHKLNKIVNFRPFVLLAIFLLLGVSISAVVRNSGVLFILFLVAPILLGVVFLIRKHKFIAISLFTFVIGFCLFFVSFTMAMVEPISRENAFIEGRVKSVVRPHVYVIEDVCLAGEELTRDVELKANVDLEIGELITFRGDIEALEENPFSTYYMSKFSMGVGYSASSDSVNVVGKDELGFYEKTQVALKDVTTEYMGEEASSVVRSLLIGDKSGLSYELKEDMSISGLSHLFSVSGLHVAFLCAVIFFIARILRLSDIVSLGLATVILVFYGFLTGFPAGIVRASVMCIASLVANSVYRRYDPLSALALAVIVMTFIDPTSLFQLSFQMSFTAVLGIICFYPMFRRGYRGKFNKFPTKILDAVNVSVSANSIMLAVMASAFGSFSIYFILANLIAVPYTSLIYSLLMLVMPIILIFPALGVILYPVKYLIIGFTAFSHFVATLPGASVSFVMPLVGALVYAFTLIFTSDFIMVDNKYKKIYLPAGLLLSVICTFIA